MKQLLALVLTFTLSVAGWTQSLRDTVRLAAFMDGVIQTHLRDLHIAGATVSVIQDGNVVLAKGYGFSDIEKRTPVDPASSLFRIGSISKMFTWISVMQLVSQGKLKLDEDINHYLKDFKIPETYPKPITLTDLMTHTPGFEDLVIGLFAKDSLSLKPLAEIFQTQMPARVRPPGSFSSYSNHGTGMAAYIVEQVSGVSFNQYVEQNILGPLQMNHTSFRQPLPARLRPDLSKGYKYEDGEFVEQGFEYVPLYPVGAAASSAMDMTHFMSAILQHGKWNGARILDSATLALMEQPAHRHHPAVNPMRYGFMDLSRNGVTVIGHGGNTFWFHSLMVIFPESNSGLFISFNTDKGGSTSLDVMNQFMDEYFPEKNPLKASVATNRKSLQAFEGNYRVNRFAYRDITTVSSLFGHVKISVKDSTQLKVVFGDKVKYYVPIGDLTFREVNSSSVIAFRADKDLGVTNMFLGEMPILALDKVSGLQSTLFHALLFVTFVVVMLVVLIYLPLAAFSRGGYKFIGAPKSMSAWTRGVAWFNYFLSLVFFLGLVVVLSNPEDIVYGVSSSLKFLLALPLLCIFLTGWMVINVFRLAGDVEYKTSSRVFYTFITLVSVAELWQLYYWNFIGYNY